LIGRGFTQKNADKSRKISGNLRESAFWFRKS